MTKRLVVLFALVVTAAACAHTTRSLRVAPYTAATVLHALSTEDLAAIDQHCPYGAPRKQPGGAFGPTQVVSHSGYVLEHDASLKIALWVCEAVDREHLEKHATRKDNFKPEPKLEGKPRAELADYKGSGFARGHMVPSEDQIYDQARNDETFFLSNMVPQDSPLNSGVWSGLEARVRKWVEDGVVRDAKVVTAGFFYDPAEEQADTADGLIPYSQIGDNLVAVPPHVYKIVVGHDQQGTLQAIAFALPNKKPPQGAKLEDFIRSIEWLERWTALDFMPDLDPAEQRRLERQASAMWKN